jgi:ethanolamine-phosphate phospho-lyase
MHKATNQAYFFFSIPTIHLIFHNITLQIHMATAMQSVLHEHFGIQSSVITKLAGYDNENFLVETGDSKYILKTYQQPLFDLLAAESDVLVQLNQSSPGLYPAAIPDHQGHAVWQFEKKGKKSIGRLLSYLEGQFFAEAAHTPALFRSLGAFLANMDIQLQGVRNYVIQSRQFHWDLQHLMLTEPYVTDITNNDDKKLVQYFMQQFKQNVLPKIPHLRKSIIHNDANDWNLLVSDGAISGIIDFGDLTYAPLINEVAIGITYGILGKEEPIRWACYILEAYHSIFALKPREVDLLYYLIAGRLCLSTANAAHSTKAEPDNEYISVSEKPVRRLLRKWLEINPSYACHAFRRSLKMETEITESVDQKISRRHRSISPIVSVSYSRPVFMKRAAFQYMYDGYGHTFLDAYNNIPHVGHCHPAIVEAGQQQMARLNTNTRYIYDQLSAYAEKLLAKFPKPLSKVFFVNSGSAASDLAVRMAQHATNRKSIMVVEHGYHGHTMTGIAISDYKFSQNNGPGQQAWVLKAPLPGIYRGRHKGAEAGDKYAQEAADLLENFNAPIAAFITEPVVGCGGQVPLAPGYLQALYPIIRTKGGVCISDEVQTGFGRLGTHFWGFEVHGVVPDIVVLGKPMGNGHPMGAVVTTDEIAGAFEKGVEFFSSFGGNPVSCAIGMAVLDVLEEEQLQQHALAVGQHYRALMKGLQNEFTQIGDLRGSGLFLGFEMVDHDGNPDTTLAKTIKNELRDRHILISTDGPYNNVLKSKPPMCFTKSNAEQVVEQIADILRK